MVRPSPPVDAASQPATSLVIATANVLTPYLQEEAQGETWAPSARRAALAKQIRAVGVDTLGVQEDHFATCEGYAIGDFRSDAGRLWRDGALDQYQHLRPCTGSCFYPRPVQTCGHVQGRRSHSRLLCVLHAPSGTPSSPRFEEWWDSTGSILRTVFRPTRDRIVVIDANGRLGESPTLPCWGAPPDRTSTITGSPSSISCAIGT